MSKSYRRAALGAATAALLSAGAAQAAPHVSYVSAYPQNPRTTTETRFYTQAGTGTFTYGWDFAGGSAFQTGAEPTRAHTFSADGIHPVAWQVTDTANESASGRFILASHPDNWAPRVTLDSYDQAVTGYGYGISPYVSDDSPEKGWTYAFEADGDNDFNDGEVIDPERPDLRGFVWETDGPHDVKVRVSDGQGQTTEAAAVYTTHTENRAPIVEAPPEVVVRTNDNVFVYAYTNDDYTDYSELIHEWYVDGVKVDSATSWYLELPPYTEVGEHTFKLVVTEPGSGGLKTEVTGKIKVVDEVHAGEAAISVYRDGDFGHSAAPAFATLENASLTAYVPGAFDVPVIYEWDLDADGQFDDANLYGTYFSALNKGTYKVAVRATPQGQAPIVVERTIVVDSGPDYAPKGDPVVVPVPDNKPPVVTPPAQAKPIGKPLATIGSVVLSDGAVAGGKPGITAQGINLKARSLFFGSVFSLKPAQVTVDYTAPLTKAGKVKASTAAKKKKAKTLKLGRSVVNLPGNASAPLKVKLSAKAKKALGKVKKVKVTARIKVKDLAGTQSATSTKTIKLKIVKK